SQLDGRGADEVVDWVSNVCHASGLTVLIAESRLGRWSQKAHRLGHLDSGRLAALGPVEDTVAKMPMAPPLAQAARALGLAHWAGEGAEAELRSRLAAIVDGRIDHPVPASRRLRASGLRFAFDGMPVLAGVDLEVGEGEMVALVGRNGSGKTTLLRCLIGLLAPQAGAVELDGTSIQGQPVAERARRIGYVPQWPTGLLFAPDLRQELQITLRNLGREAGGGIDPEEVLARFGLLEVADRYPRDLSAGQRQRAALAAILVARPDVLLLDEPTLGMDPMAEEDLARLLADLRREGAAVLVATHDVEFAARHAQRCYVLEEGKVATAGPTAESLFSRPSTRTALQRLTGRARPATARDIELVS
ncbi:MAG: energy-coupling factor ABC transporter ATP-binding protein, partial [Anaerolineales bacterium]